MQKHSKEGKVFKEHKTSACVAKKIRTSLLDIISSDTHLQNNVYDDSSAPLLLPMLLIVHFTVVWLDAKPLKRGKAKDDLVMI